jgi:hypothetical protein
MRLLATVLVGLALFISVSVSHASVVAVNNESTWQATAVTWNLADFEGFLGPATNHYTGVTFSDFNGGSPFTIDQFPYQGINSTFTVFTHNAGGGGWAAEFDSPVKAVAFWSGDVEFSGSVVSLYDSASTLLGFFDLLASGGGNGPFVYGFNGFVSDSLNISKVTVAINSWQYGSGDAIWFDNFQFASVPQASVPEPITFLLFSSALIAIVTFKKLRKV